jgi:hypothetical protein
MASFDLLDREQVTKRHDSLCNVHVMDAQNAHQIAVVASKILGKKRSKKLLSIGFPIAFGVR